MHWTSAGNRINFTPELSVIFTTILPNFTDLVFILWFGFFQRAFVLLPLFCVSNPLVSSISSVWSVVFSQRLPYETSFHFKLRIKPCKGTFIFTDCKSSFHALPCFTDSLTEFGKCSLNIYINLTNSIFKQSWTSLDEHVSKYCCTFSAFQMYFWTLYVFGLTSVPRAVLGRVKLIFTGTSLESTLGTMLNCNPKWTRHLDIIK